MNLKNPNDPDSNLCKTTINGKEYTIIKVTNDNDSGFAGITLYDETTKKAYIVPKGSVPLDTEIGTTAWINDWCKTNEYGFLEDHISKQMIDSITFANESLQAIKNFETSKNYQNNEIIATGHSLAGGEVELWGMLNNFSGSNIKLYTFDAAPAAGLYDDLAKYIKKNNLGLQMRPQDDNFDNIINYSVKGDLASDIGSKIFPWLKHIGDIYKLDPNPLYEGLQGKHDIRNFISPFEYSPDTSGLIWFDYYKKFDNDLRDLINKWHWIDIFNNDKNSTTHQRYFTTAEANALWYDPLTFWKLTNSPYYSSQNWHSTDTLKNIKSLDFYNKNLKLAA